MNARKVKINIEYQGKNITDNISQYITDFSYNDEANGKGDTVSINVADKNKNWLSNLPHKYDVIKSSIILENWVDNKSFKFFCGTFYVDQLNINSNPLTIKIGAISTPVETSFKTTERKKTWKSETIETIAQNITKNIGVKLVYEADKIYIKSIEQSTNDCDFLYSVCEKYGLSMKIFNDKIIIYDEERYEKKSIIATLQEKDIITLSYNATLEKNYTCGKMSYSSTSSKNDIKVTIGTGKRWLNVSEKADSKADAELKLKARIKQANNDMNTMSITIYPNPKIIATSVIFIQGFGNLSGKYYVKSVSHSINNIYTMTLELRKL